MVPSCFLSTRCKGELVKFLYCALFCAGIVACNGTGSAPPQVQPSVTAPSDQPPQAQGVGGKEIISLPFCSDCLTKRLAFVWGGTTRYFHLYLPASKASQAVMILHGNGGSADQVLGLGKQPAASPLKAWLSLAKRHRLVLVVPEGTTGLEGKPGWNDCRSDSVGNPKADDVGFLSSLSKAVAQKYGISKSFVTGMSNGGHMSIRLASEAPESFLAAAPISAGVAGNSQCVAKNQPVSVLLMRGTADPLLPFDGGAMAGNRGQVLSMDESLKVFLSWNKIAGSGSRETLPNVNLGDKSTVDKITYPAGPSGTKVEGYVVSGGGHTEPSKTEFYGFLFKKIVGEQNRDLETSDVVWDFFSTL